MIDTLMMRRSDLREWAKGLTSSAVLSPLGISVSGYCIILAPDHFEIRLVRVKDAESFSLHVISHLLNTGAGSRSSKSIHHFDVDLLHEILTVMSGEFESANCSC